jgi:hypothetical protein
MLNEKGSLAETPTIKILLTIFEQGLTGVLSVKRESIQKILYFKKGRLIWAISNSINDELDSLIISRGLVATKNIERVKQMVDSPDSLGKVLVEKGLISLEELIEASREQLKGIVSSILKWPEGKFRFASEEPPERMLNLELNITDFIRDFILKGLDIGFIRQQVGSVEAKFVKNTDNQKIKRYNFSEQQLELLDCFDGATSLENILSRYPQEHRETVLKIIYYFLMAEILLDERLEFSDSPALREKEPTGSLEVESTEYKNKKTAEPVEAGEQEKTYGIEREIEVQKPTEIEDILDAAIDTGAGEAAGQEPFVVETGRAEEVEEVEDNLRVDYEAEEKINLDGSEGQQQTAYELGGEIETGRAEEVATAVRTEHNSEEGGDILKQEYATAQEGSEAYVVESNEVIEPESRVEPPTEPAGPRPGVSFSEPIEAKTLDGAEPGLKDFELPDEKAPGKAFKKDALKFGAVDRKFSDEMEPIKVGEDFIEDREPAPFRKPVVVDKKKSKLVYLILLSVVAIFVISGSIFLYLNSSKEEVGEDVIPPVNVAEQKAKVKEDGKRTEIVMEKQDKTGKQTANPEDIATKEPMAQDSQAAKEIPAKQPPGKIHERFDITSDELKKKLMDKNTAVYFRVKLGDPQAVKYFKEGKFMEAGSAWEKELKKAGIKFAILLEMDCMKESVINAYLKIIEKDDFYILNRKLGNRNCFLVLWGKFYTKQEGGDALKMIPEYFRNQQHPPEVISLSRYLYN